MNTEFKKIKIAVIGTGTAGCLQTLKLSQELNFEYFESEANKWIVKTIIKYYEEYKSQPTLAVL